MINRCSPDYSDKHYINIALQDMSKHLGIKADAEFAAVNVNWNCIPQYRVGHDTLILKLKREMPEVHFAGPLFHPPGLVDCCLNAFRIAKKISQN